LPTPVGSMADSVFEGNGGSQVDSLCLRAETSPDFQDFARWRQRPRARQREAYIEIDVARRSNDLLSMTQLDKTSAQRESRPVDVPRAMEKARIAR